MSTQCRDGAGARESAPSILIADDYSDLAEPLARLLQRMGYRADIVSNGQQAIRYLQQHRPALVILDLMMPVVDGVQVLLWMRALPATASLPVILFTSSNDQDLLRQCMEAGANDVWIKGGLDFFQIMTRIATYVPPPKKQNP